MINWFKQVVGEENVSDRDIDKFVYSTDASNILGRVNFVVWPENEKQIHTIVLFAKRNKISLVIRGAGSSLTGGTVPEKNAIVLDLSKMNHILKINEDEKYAIVETGVTARDLNEALTTTFFPILNDKHKISTIGGMIATNALSIKCLKYGRMKDWVEELEIIDGTGKSWRIVGDNIKFFCGREGISGVILKAKIKLAEIPKFNTMEMFEFEEIDELVERMQSLKNEPDITAIEFVDKWGANFVGLSQKYVLIIELENTNGHINNEKEMKRIWGLRDKVSNVLGSKGYLVNLDVKVPEEKTVDFLYYLKNNKIPSFGRIGAGIFHLKLKQDSEKLIPLYGFLKRINADIMGEYGVGILKRDNVDPEYVKKIKILKNQYDPIGIFNKNKIYLEEK